MADDVLSATIQWRDLFDESFGVNAADCSEFLDWPGRIAPFSRQFIAEQMGGQRDFRDTDWDQHSRFNSEVKFQTYKEEIIGSNPELAALWQTKLVFLMRSAGETRAMRELDGGVIIADALWLSFASFSAQTRFASWPQPEDPLWETNRENVAVHFALRALLYQAILRNIALKKVERDSFRVIWETYPSEWEGDFGLVVFAWTGLGRFIVAHEFAHLVYHAPADCTPDAVRSRGIVPEALIEELEHADEFGPLDGFLYEVEADLSAISMCENYLLQVLHKPRRRSFRRPRPEDDEPTEEALEAGAILFTNLYYMFLCLEELARKVTAKTAYPQRRHCIAKFLGEHRMVGSPLITLMDREFAQRAKFYFDLSDQFRDVITDLQE